MNCFCPICGFLLDEPAYDDDGTPSFDICPCCKCEFGYDLEGGSGAEMSPDDYRLKWLKSLFLPKNAIVRIYKNQLRRIGVDIESLL